MSKKQTLAEINNNPLNIRYNPQNQWKGQTGQNRGFCTFTHEAYGIRAAYIILTNYIKNGYDTIHEIVSRWAPPTENNTEEYVKFVSVVTLIDPEEHLNDETIHDYWTRIDIIRAMARMESGKVFDHQLINLYINYPQRYEKNSRTNHMDK